LHNCYVSIFLVQEIDQNGRTNGDEFWWANGGEPINISQKWPGGTQALEQMLGDRRTFDLYQFTDSNGQELIAVIDKDRQVTEYVFRDGQWVQESIPYLNLFEEAMRLADSAEVILPNEVSEPTRLQIGVTDKLVEGHGGLIYAILLNPEAVNNGIAQFITQNMANNNGVFTLPIYNPETRTVEPTQVNPNTDIKVTFAHYEDDISLPHGYGVGDPVEFGVFLRDGHVELVIKVSAWFKLD
jgi:hypothetical protein